MAVSKIVKCSNCNIVICEVLAFVQNKLDVMDEQSLIQICESAFSVEDIEVAKLLLFESVNKRPKTRKRQGKTMRNIEDIICLFKETDPEQVPIFVAKRLEKLPPISFDHIDVTALLKKIVLLEKSVHDIQHDYVKRGDLTEVITKYSNIPSSLHSDNINVNLNRGGGFDFMFDSGPMALTSYNNLSPTVEVSEPGMNENTQCPVQDNSIEPTLSETDECKDRPVVTTVIGGTAEGILRSSPKRTMYSEVVQKDGEWKESKGSEEWIRVQRKRLRNRFISQKGSALVEPGDIVKFKAADTKVPLFISNVHKDVDEQDIINYIYEKTQERVSLVKIKMTRQRDYSAYKLFVAKYKVDTFLDENLWPPGISFRRFVNFFKMGGHSDIYKDDYIKEKSKHLQ